MACRLAKNIFFSEGIKKFVQRWKKCIEKRGDYVEKLCYYKFSVFIEIKFASVVRVIIDSLSFTVLYLSIRGCHACHAVHLHIIAQFGKINSVLCSI